MRKFASGHINRTFCSNPRHARTCSGFFRLESSVMAKTRRVHGPLTAAQSAIFQAVAAGKTVADVAKERGVETSSVRTQLFEGCRKIGLRRHQVPGCMDRLSDVQRDMLVPRSHPRGVRAPRFSWPPEECPCCGQKWPVTAAATEAGDAPEGMFQ